MRSYILRAGSSSLDDLVMVERDEPRPGTREVLIRVRACSLNYRDQAVMTGNYFGGKVPHDQVPLSDGAGEVVEVGGGVTKFKAGRPGRSRPSSSTGSTGRRGRTPARPPARRARPGCSANMSCCPRKRWCRWRRI